MINLSCLNDNDFERLEDLQNGLYFASELFDYYLEPHDSTILINVLREYDHRLESLEKLIHNYSKYLDSLWLDSLGITTRIKEKWNQMRELL